jgi:hypothetical protein
MQLHRPSKARFNDFLWRHVAAVRRLPRWQQVSLMVAWVLLVVAAVYFWTSSFDCPMCD